MVVPLYYPPEIESVDTKVTRRSFERVFGEFISNLGEDLPKISSVQMDVFFNIADEFLHYKRGSPSIRRQYLRDFAGCKRLVKVSSKQLKSMEAAIQKFNEKGGPLTSALATSVMKEIGFCKERLGGMFFDQEHELAGHRSLLSRLSQKTLVYEFTLDLEMFVNHQFSHLTQKNKDFLIAAAMTAAQVFTKDEIRNDVVGLIPMKRYYARKYYEKYYAGIGRVYAWIPRKKKG